MLNPKYQRYAERLKELIQEAKEVAILERVHQGGGHYIDDKATLNSWLVKVRNILEAAYGCQSQHFQHFDDFYRRHLNIQHSNEVNTIRGILEGALDDLEKGFLTGQEFLIAGEIFDTVLEQAKQLNKAGYKDPAAILARVVVEDALRRIARKEGIDDTKKASNINDELKKADRYGQPRWRRVQAWLDIGNSAAHGKFNEYTSEDVKAMVEEIERFLAEEMQIG